MSNRKTRLRKCRDYYKTLWSKYWFDPEERRREKQAARDEDYRRLKAGEVTEEQLRKENAFFSDEMIRNSKFTLPRF